MQIAAVVNTLGQGRIAFEPPGPDTDLSFADLEAAFLRGAQPDETRRLVVVLRAAASVEGSVFR